jgi:hypothetical protein
MLNLPSEKELLLVVANEHWADRVRQSPLRHVSTRDRRRRLNVAGGPRRHALTAEHELLRHAAAIGFHEHGLELLARDRDAIVFRKREREA